MTNTYERPELPNYFNHAACGPMPRSAVARIKRVADQMAAEGDASWASRLRDADRVRDLGARLIRAATHEIAFAANTSDGLSVAANGLDWQPGDNVVGADCEFPSNVYPWLRLGALGVDYRLAPERDGRLDIDEILGLVDQRTRVVALSWVQYASGFRIDLARIGEYCRARGVLFVVDAIQGLGALDIDVERDRVDVLSADAHKWLLGPEGVAMLYVSDRVLERIAPVRVGWTSVENFLEFRRGELRYRRGAARFEPGTLNSLGIAGLGGSLELLLSVGTVAIEARIRELTDRIVGGLQACGWRVVSSRRPGEWSGIVAATHESLDPHDVTRRLTARGIHVSARAGRLRISPHFWNTEEEVDRLLAALEANDGITEFSGSQD
jgi:selenocysteine lyase/cysteine desulfurase